MPATATKIGQTVRERRLSAGLTHEQLSCLVGCDANTVGRIERGEGDPSLRVLKRLSEVFGVPVDEMLDVRQPTFAGEMERCAKMLRNLHGDLVDDLRLVAESTANGEVCAFYSQVASMVTTEAFKTDIQAIAQWLDAYRTITAAWTWIANDQGISEPERALRSEENRKQKVAHVQAKPTMREHLPDNFRTMFDAAQCRILSGRLSPESFAEYSRDDLCESIHEFTKLLQAAP